MPVLRKSGGRGGVLVVAVAALWTLSVHTTPLAPAAAFAPSVVNPARRVAASASSSDADASTHILAASASDGANDGGEGSSSSSSSAVKEDMNPVTRASWFAVEAFGKVFGGGGKEKATASDDAIDSSTDVDLTRPPRSLDEALARIKLDNDRSYFLSGEVDSLAYDEACTFADPFVSFDGRDRFVDNLSNLGSFITEYDAKMLNYDVSEDGATVKTKVMVKLELNLPWKPVLAWPWGVEYSIDPDTCLITKHEESWDIEPWEGVKQIFRKPTVSINKQE